MKTNHGTPLLLAFIFLASLSAASAKTIISLHGSVTNDLDTNAVIKIGAHLTGPSIRSVAIAPFKGHGFIKPAHPAAKKVSGLATCRFKLTGSWVQEDGAVYLTGTVQSSADRRLIGAQVYLAVSPSGFTQFNIGLLDFFGGVSTRFHETK